MKLAFLVALAVPVALAAPISTTHPIDDAAILAMLEAANSWDIAIGTAASAKGATVEVRDFGATLARDHTNLRQLGRDMAQKLGMVLPASTDDAWRSLYDEITKELDGLSGAAYDKAFLAREAEYLADMIDAVKDDYLPAAGEIKPLLKQTIPVLEAHQKRAAELTRKYPPGIR